MENNNEEEVPNEALLSEEFLDSLDEVHTRFILNVPQDELSTSERIFFQLEQAWWYYEDLICDKIEEETGSCPLPRFANMKPFSKRLFDFSPLLRDLDFAGLYKEFSVYKRKISTYGCILLNRDRTHVALCKMYKSKVWTFPAGKINQNEIGIDAAAREVYEETGFDPHCRLGGLTKDWLDSGDPDGNITWSYPLRDPEDALTFVEQPSGKRRTCYVCCGVPEDFPFEPVCRKEIDVIEWVDLRDIKEYKSFAVLPFVGKLKKWIKTNSISKSKKANKKERKNNKSRPKSREKDKSAGRAGSKGRQGSRQKNRNGNSSRKKDRAMLVEGGLIGSMGESTRWTEEEMFETNARLQGGSIPAYDGNPHLFAEKGFGVDDEATGSKRVDPHAFRVVGGSFMNSEHGDRLAETSDSATMAARYQPLVRDTTTEPTGGGGGGDNSNTVAGLQPFFSDEGATPWGDVVDDTKSKGSSHHGESDDWFAGDGSNSGTNINKKASQDLLAMLRSDSPVPQSIDKKDCGKSSDKTAAAASASASATPVSGDYNYDDDDDDDEMMIFATDKEITAKKQRDYERKKKQQQQQQQQQQNTQQTPPLGSREAERLRKEEEMRKRYETDMAFVQNWVNNLPNPTNFTIPNVDEILTRHFGADAVRQAKAAEAARNRRLGSNGHGETGVV